MMELRRYRSIKSEKRKSLERRSHDTWGTVRVGFFGGETQRFYRLIGPASLLRFALGDCTDYCDRRVPVIVSSERKYGFVTEIKLESVEIRSTTKEVPESITNKIARHLY